MNGKRVSSLYLKNAMKTKINKIGKTMINAAYLATPFLNKTFHTPREIPSPTASVMSWKMVIVNGQKGTHILSQPPEILRGIKILFIMQRKNNIHKYTDKIFFLQIYDLQANHKFINKSMIYKQIYDL